MKTIEIIATIESAQSLEDLQNLFFEMQEANETGGLDEVDDYDWLFISRSVQIKANTFLPPDDQNEISVTLQ